MKRTLDSLMPLGSQVVCKNGRTTVIVLTSKMCDRQVSYLKIMSRARADVAWSGKAQLALAHSAEMISLRGLMLVGAMPDSTNGVVEDRPLLQTRSRSKILPPTDEVLEFSLQDHLEVANHWHPQTKLFQFEAPLLPNLRLSVPRDQRAGCHLSLVRCLARQLVASITVRVSSAHQS